MDNEYNTKSICNHGDSSGSPVFELKVDYAHLKEKQRLLQNVVAASQIFGATPDPLGPL